MGVVRFLGVLACVAQLISAGGADAAVSITATRTELLYSAESEIECSELSQTADAELPFNVARLRAVLDQPAAGVVYKWSVRKPFAGHMVADLDLGPQEQTSIANGMCAEFGNACELTGQRLQFYNDDSILWVAPHCGELPTDTTKQPKGGTVKIKVKVKSGRQSLGKASVTLGYGRDGSIKLSAWTGERRADGSLVFADGLGKKNGVGVPSNSIFAATPELPAVAPGPIINYVFDNGAGGRGTVTAGCLFAPQFTACDQINYGSLGRFVANVTAVFSDEESALCDNVTVRVLECNPNAKLTVRPTPDRDVYDPTKPNQNPVNLVVRLKNTSQPTDTLPACNFLLQGANVLVCESTLKTGSLKETRVTRFDLQRCSTTQGQGCDTDLDCQSPQCPNCVPGEVCLTQNHCSETFTQPCNVDADCSNSPPMAACPACNDDESCTRVLAFGKSLFLVPGESVDLINRPVTMKNQFSQEARFKDEWTASTSAPVETDSAIIKYKVKSRPDFSPTP